MGWFFPEGATRDQVIEEVTPRERTYGERAGGGSFRTLRRRINGDVVYAVHESELRDGTTKRWIGVYLLREQGGAWGLKCMDETMHPMFYGCPLSFLELAGPTGDRRAQEWRNEVLRQATELKAKNPT